MATLIGGKSEVSIGILEFVGELSEAVPATSVASSAQLKAGCVN